MSVKFTDDELKKLRNGESVTKENGATYTGSSWAEKQENGGYTDSDVKKYKDMYHTEDTAATVKAVDEARARDGNLASGLAQGKARMYDYMARNPYDSSVDYSDRIEYAESLGNDTAAAYYEMLRNRKIAGENLGYVPTEKYRELWDSFVPADYLRYLDDSYAKKQTYVTDETIGEGWLRDIRQLEELGEYDEANRIRMQQGLYTKDYETGEIIQLGRPDWSGYSPEDWIDVNMASKTNAQWARGSGERLYSDAVRDYYTYLEQQGKFRRVGRDGRKISDWRDFYDKYAGESVSAGARIEGGNMVGAGSVLYRKEDGTASEKGSTAEHKTTEKKSGGYAGADAAGNADENSLRYALWESANRLSGEKNADRLSLNERHAGSGLGSGAHETALEKLESGYDESLAAVRRAGVESMTAMRAGSAMYDAYLDAVREALVQGRADDAEALYLEFKKLSSETEN